MESVGDAFVTPLRFAVFAPAYALTRLPPDAEFPLWPRGGFVTVTRGPREITVVCEEAAVPAGLETQGGYRCLEIRGEHTLDAVGVVASATAPLARAGISVFVFSVWSNDFLLVPSTHLAEAFRALFEAGHTID